MEFINRLDISYNDAIQIKVTSEEEMSKHDLQMKALEALLTNMSMDLTEPGQDPMLAVESLLNRLYDHSEQLELKPHGQSTPAPRETLIEQFKRFYADYRKTSEMDRSFTSAFDALTFSVIEQTARAAELHDLETIKHLMREYREIRDSVGGSNDPVKERFEEQLQQFAETH